MLPLDRLSPAAEKAVQDAGIPTENIAVVLRLDLDLEGRFGESWLLYDNHAHALVRLLGDADTICSDLDEKEMQKRKRKPTVTDILNPTAHLHAAAVRYVDSLDLTYYTDAAVDNFASSNRIVLQKHDAPRPDTEGMEEEEKKATLQEWNRGRTAFIAGYCTNSRKQRLFAFLDIVERLLRGDEVGEDDPIFDQFNMRCPKCGRVYEDQNRRVCTYCVDRGALMKRLLGYFKPFKWQLSIGLICMLATSGISLLSPIINGQILYDRVIASSGIWHTWEKLILVLCVVFGLALVSLGINIIQNRNMASMSTRVTRQMKLDIFTAMQRLSLAYFNQNSTGRLINRVNYDANRINSFYIDGVPNLIINGLNFIGLTIFLFIMNWKLTLIVFLPVPLIICIFKFMLPKLWRMYTKQWRSSSSLNSMLGDSLNGIRVVKAFAKEAEETNRFYSYSQRLYEANLKVNMVSLTIFPLVGLLIGISSQAIWGVGGISVMGGDMTYGEFTTYLGYIGMIFGPLQFFTNFTNMLTDTINSAERMFEVLDANPDIMDAPEAVELETLKGDITFKNVCFHYNPNRPILKDVNIEIHAGDNIGLVGHTGSGKSTIANLITRMYDTISGTIYLDGIDIRKIKTESLRKNIAIVSQEIFLFRGSIADNIRYARPDATMEEVIEAARAAHAHDFIERLPQGYETEVGTGSRSLSGGEKQRISIARALLLSPSLLILDEATAAMDTETERLISDALAKLVQGRTTISIAHRLSTLKDCNYLFAIENGEIAEEGTREELMEKRGVYYKLYTLQSQAMKKVLSGM